ncbi:MULTISPECIES: bifunctional proline dehydrogenase/L-glutamate gamma-semialdehyde dehydrogenase [unclassified Microbacterium]|uniref:proline dehydrogenase family protein n=1 Tax=unclassified Microbacterium TaxID=2609290 RepID=UPI000C2C51B5|nr:MULTISPECIES: bifunctional proline dehydrogenase/L-glutamate gamma-semialdehyde dehydrogenase [unclassified Microbacterium]
MPPLEPNHASPGHADTREAEAVRLAEKWVAESAESTVDPSARRLAGILGDRNGLPFTVGFVDGVMRPESLVAAASHLHRVAPLVPEFLPWYLRAAVRVGGQIAPGLPAPVVPIARRVLREMVGHLVVDARPAKLGPAIQRLRADGARLNLNLLGEAVLGEGEARRRLEGIHELILRPDVDYVSVKVSAIVSSVSLWAFDDTVDRVVERLLPLYLSAVADGTFINLDMEEYRDLDLTIAVFTRLLEDPRLASLEAGIVLQAYLPDALPALRELTAWARVRVAAGGARIKVRLVKGANLAMERVDAALHGWTLATYDSKLDTDANYVRCLDEALRPEATAAVRLGVAGHNLFDVAYAWLLAGERGVRDDVDIEMLLGMAQAQVKAVEREVGRVLLYVPVVRPDEFDVAISYLVRRLEESASSENFLSAAFDLDHDPALWQRERARFGSSIARASKASLAVGPRRRPRADVSTRPPVDSGDVDLDETLPAIRRPALGGPNAEPDAGLTQVVLGIAEGANAGTLGETAAPAPSPFRFGDDLVETAVYAPREKGADVPALGFANARFANARDSDPSLPETRSWAAGVLARVPGSEAGIRTILAARLDSETRLDELVARTREAGAAWGARPAADRAAVLTRAASVLEARRGDLIEVAAAETGKIFAEADVEVSEAVDFARYYAASAHELDAVSGAVFVPARLTLVTPPWNFPLAIPAGGVLAALAAGSAVVFKPAPQARRCAAVLADALWDAGVPRDVLALADIDEGGLGRQLVAHDGVDRVILTGSWETAALFRSWRPDLPLLAETSGKNAMIITPTADLDLAARDLVRSAFGHAGQKCSAASLAILVGPVARSRRFARQLVDATASLRIGMPEDPRSDVGPLIEPPTGKLAWALTTLDDGERWLVQPRPLDDERRLWTPGIRTGVEDGSRFHREEFFGPVLGIMRARSIEDAIELQNAVDYGLTAGLYTQDPADLERWLESVEAGNLYVNRGITGAIVRRQPFGGWKRSSVGAGTKAGGPNYLIGLGSWRPSAGGARSASLHLRGLDSRLTAIIEAAQATLDYEAFEWLRRAALSDAISWDREFGQVRDVSRLGVERNLFRYRPVPVAVRATGDADWRAVLRVILAGVRARSRFSLSAPVALPPAVRRVLSELNVDVRVETDAQWIERMAVRPVGGSARSAATADDAPPAPETRARLIGSPAAVVSLRTALAEATGGNPDLAVYTDEVTTAARIELLPFLHEQSISITAHRFGTPDPWSEAVI